MPEVLSGLSINCDFAFLFVERWVWGCPWNRLTKKCGDFIAGHFLTASHLILLSSCVRGYNP